MMGGELFLRRLYGTAFGRRILKLFISPGFSRLGGWVLNTRLSALAVGPFVRRHGVDLSRCEKARFSSYNDFFTRRLLPGERPIDFRPEALISPCDGRLSLRAVTAEGRFSVKGRDYTLGELLRDEALAEEYLGGTVWLFRLSVEDYHRYIYPDDAYRGPDIAIPGVFNTVRPLAGQYRPVYHENTRVYCRLETARFGPVLMMEVGAMLVGKIENRPHSGAVMRGQEKGNFAFGGSTVLLVTKPGAAEPEPPFAPDGEERPVRQGQAVGHRPAGGIKTGRGSKA